MASAVFDPSPTPVTRHPLFPAIVAMWFAMLLGFGVLIVPVAALEGLLESSGLAAFVPVFALPLDLPGRMLIAAIAAALGAVLGVSSARQLVRVQDQRAFDAPRAEPASRRPISAHEELGEPGLSARRHGRLVDIEPAEHQPQAEAPLELVELAADEPAILDLVVEADEPAAAEPAADTDKPFETLSLRQLVDRLGTSMEARRGRAAIERPSIVPEAPVADEPDRIAPVRFGRSTAKPLDFGRVSRPFDPPSPDAANGPAPRYASSADADDALRRALDTLQRMTSAG